MPSETIRFSVESKYGYSGQYIAKIVGRDDRVTFQREFRGSRFGKRSECTAYETDEMGLYELCDVTKRGKDKSYRLVLPWRGELVSIASDSSDALKIAKRLGDGESLDRIVVAELGEPLEESQYYNVCSVCKKELPSGSKCDEHPEGFRESHLRKVPKVKEDGSPLRAIVYRIVSKSEAGKAESAKTLDSAVDAICLALASLPYAIQRKALVAAKARICPSKSRSATDPEPDTDTIE